MAYFQALGDIDEKRRLAAVRSLLDDVVGGDKVEKTITRLVRGLCSGREASRVGFSIALTELLGQARYEGDILKLLLVETAGGKASGQDERDHCFGRLFGIKALLESGIDLDWNRVLNIAFELAEKKPWLREQVVFVICGQLRSLDRSVAAIESFHSHGLLNTSEGIALMLSARQYGDLPAVVWGGDPLAAGNAKQLKNALLEGVPGEIPQKGSWSHNPHFVWPQIFAQLSSPQASRLTFAEFWDAIVENGLFADNASDERKFWGFQILAVCVAEVSPSLLETVFSPKVRRSLVNQLSAERLLHGAAENVSNAITSRTDPEAAAAIVRIFIANSSASNDTLLKIANKAAVHNPSGALQEFLTAIERPADKSEARRLFLLDKLLHFLRSTKSEEVTGEAIAFLVKHAYFKPLKHAPKPSFSEKARDVCRIRLHSCLVEVSKTELSTKWVLAAAKEVQKLEKKGKHRLVHAVDEETKSVAYDLLKSKKTLHADFETVEDSFQMLCALALLLLFDEDEDAGRIVTDLKDCLGLLQKPKSVEREQGIGNHISTICYDFVASSSALYRKAASMAFAAFSDFMGADALNPYYLVIAEEFMATEEAQAFVLGEENIDSDVELLSDEGSDSDESEGETDAEKLANDQLLNEALGKLFQTKPLDVEMADASDSDDDSATSSQMEKLDDQIVAAFRERAKLPGERKKKKLEKEEAANHKLRCVDMLAAFVKKQHSRAVCLSLLVPLCGTVRMAREESVRQRANGLLHQYDKLAKSDKEIAGFDHEDGWRVFDAIQEMTSKDSPSKTAIKAQSTAMLIISRALVHADRGSMGRIVASYSTALSGWVNDKTSGYHVTWFLDFINWCQSIRTTHQKTVRGTKRSHDEMDGTDSSE